MGHSRGSRFARGAVAARRSRGWAVGPGTGTGGDAQAITTSSTVLAGVGALAVDDGLTIVRTRGECLLYLISADAPNAGYFGAIGIAKVTGSAFAIGATAIPAPLDEEDWDGWAYHRYFSIFSASVIAAGAAADVDIVNSVTASLRFEIDSKAMRKFDADDVYMAVLQVFEVSTAALQWSMNSRILALLP